MYTKNTMTCDIRAHIHCALGWLRVRRQKLSTILRSQTGSPPPPPLLQLSFLLRRFAFFAFIFLITTIRYSAALIPLFSSFSSHSRNTQSSVHEHYRHQQQTRCFFSSLSTFLVFSSRFFFAYFLLFFYLYHAIGNCKRETILRAYIYLSSTQTDTCVNDRLNYIHKKCLYICIHMFVRSNFIRGHEGCVT